MIQFIYTTTKICLPKSIDICNDADKLWNFTYVHDVAGFKRLLFTQNDEIQLVDVSMTENQLNCYSGEPQLEKLMENGKIQSKMTKFSIKCHYSLSKNRLHITQIASGYICVHAKSRFDKLLGMGDMATFNWS